MYQYLRKVQYHETDKMGITHHANYIKWMEEARISFLESINLPFQLIEDRGITSPVAGLSIDYKNPSTFGHNVLIGVSITKYSGVQLEVAYTMTDAEQGTVFAVAASKHCFLKNGRVISLKRAEPDMHLAIEQAYKNSSEAEQR